MNHIQILNESTLISNDQLEPIIEALRIQVNDHLKIESTLVLTTVDNETTAIRIQDSPADVPPGYLGWHTVDGLNRPYGIIPMQIVLNAAKDPAQIISHEVLELLADPDLTGNKTVAWPANSQQLQTIAYEVCDPVENDTYPITIASGAKINVCNFVLPSWFIPNSPGPWDKCGNLKGPLTLSSGGYIQLVQADSTWKPAYGAQIEGFRMSPHYHSRVYRRVRCAHEREFPGHHDMVLKAESAIREANLGPEGINALMYELMTTLGSDSEKAINAFLVKMLVSPYKTIQVSHY